MHVHTNIEMLYNKTINFCRKLAECHMKALKKIYRLTSQYVTQIITASNISMHRKDTLEVGFILEILNVLESCLEFSWVIVYIYLQVNMPLDMFSLGLLSFVNIEYLIVLTFFTHDM